VTIRYATHVGLGVLPGRHTNTATAVSGELSDSDNADVLVETASFVQKSTVIGKVFLDCSKDGYQSGNEPGLPAVRLGTLEGLLVETDTYGRFHIAEVDTGRFDRGANFVLKVDPLTLQGGEVDPETRVVRLTPGLMTRINFAVQPEDDDPRCQEQSPERLTRVLDTIDPLTTDPRLDILAKRPASVARNKIGFQAYSSYPKRLESMKVEVFDARDVDRRDVLGSECLPLEDEDNVHSVDVEMDWDQAPSGPVRVAPVVVVPK